MEKKIEKRKICIPLKDLQSNLNSKSHFNEEFIKKYVSYFDLNPQANFYALQNIPSYKKYLYKYKYTLFYEDAKKLGCFNDVNESDLIRSINNYLRSLKINDKKFSKTDSLSKLKLIDFLLYLLNLRPLIKDFEQIIDKIQSLKLEIDLIFKAPVNLGNYELKYYFYYELFIEFFLFNYESKNKNKSKSEKKIFPSIEIEYFPTIDNNKMDYYEIDMTDFEKRKKKLLNFIEDNKKKKIDLTKDIQNKNKINIQIELNEDLENNAELKNPSDKIKEKDKIKNNSFQVFTDKLEYFTNFKDVIINIFFEDNKEEEIIEKVKFIYFYIILEIKNKEPPEEKLLNSFYMNNYECDIKRFNLLLIHLIY